MKKSTHNVPENETAPQPIITVWVVRNEIGHRTGNLAVQSDSDEHGKKTSLIAQADVIQANRAVLTQLTLHHDLRAYQSPQGLASLAKLLIAAERQDAYVADHDGFHRIMIEGAICEFFLYRGKFHKLTKTRPPLKIIAMSQSAPLPMASCSLDTWTKMLGEHLVADPVLFVCLCAAMASMLTTWLSWPRLLLALIGPSSLGKNSAQLAVTSILTIGDEVRSASGTTKGLRLYLADLPDRPVFLDEFRQVQDPENLDGLLFDGANSARRIISSPGQVMQTSAPLRSGLILSNEVSLAELFAGRRKRLDEGLTARYLEIHVDGEHGIFRCVPEGNDAKSFAELLKRRSARYYGALWDAYVPAVAAHSERIRKWAKTNVSKLEAEISRDLGITDRVVLRMVHGMATWAAVGCIAHNLKLIDADRATVVAHFRTVLREQLDRQRSASTPAAERVFEAVVSYIDKNAGRFVPIEQYDPNEHSGFVGFTMHRNGEKLFLLTSAAFKDAVATVGEAAATRHLRAAGYLQVGSQGNQLQVRTPSAKAGAPGLQRRLYAIADRIRHDR